MNSNMYTTDRANGEGDGSRVHLYLPRSIDFTTDGDCSFSRGSNIARVEDPRVALAALFSEFSRLSLLLGSAIPIPFRSSFSPTPQYPSSQAQFHCRLKILARIITLDSTR